MQPLYDSSDNDDDVYLCSPSSPPTSSKFSLVRLTALSVPEASRHAPPPSPLPLKQAELRARTEARARAAAWAWAGGVARVEVRARAARAEARARALASALSEVRAAATAERPQATAEHTFTYEEVLADLKLLDIIHSIKPYHRWLACYLSQRSHTSQEFWWLIQIIIPINRLPSELLQQILLIIIDDATHSHSALILVCRHWYTIVTGIWVPLKLGTTTPKDIIISKLERYQWFLDVSIDTEIDRGYFTPLAGHGYEAIFTAIQAISRWRTLIIETFPHHADLPEQVVNCRLQQCSDTVLSRLRTFKIKSACEMSPLLDLLLRILGTSASEELTTVEINSSSVLSFLAPTYPSIFNSVKVLSVDAPGLLNPIDLLPHLHQLEGLTLFRLPLPTYDNDVNFPFVHTLRRVVLQNVSIQWMNGRTFYTLETCTIILPLRHHLLHAFSANLPNCKNMVFSGYPLDSLSGLSAPSLEYLRVTCPGEHKLHGNRQLCRFSSQVLQESRLVPRILHIGIEAMTWAWIQALDFMSNLEELRIETAEPSSLGLKFFQSLVVHPVHANNISTTATQVVWDTPVCPSLKRFGLRYRRWLRSSEHFDLIPEFMSIIWSRQQSGFSLQSFYVWKSSNQKNPVELIEGPWISHEGFEWLAKDSERNLLQSVVSRLVGNMVKPSGKSSTACSQMQRRQIRDAIAPTTEWSHQEDGNEEHGLTRQGSCGCGTNRSLEY